MRFYKKDLINGGQQSLLSKDAAMSLTSTALYQKLPAENMIHEFGRGVYEPEFLLKDSFIAKQSFILRARNNFIQQRKLYLRDCFRSKEKYHFKKLKRAISLD